MRIYDGNINKGPLLKEAFLTLKVENDNKEVDLIAVDEKGDILAHLMSIRHDGMEIYAYAKYALTMMGYMLNTTFDESGALLVVPKYINRLNKKGD